MSALFVKCPSCGPLLSFIPQGQQFTIDVKCLCGAHITHTENCHNYPTRRTLNKKINEIKGKHTVDVCDLRGG